MDDDYISSLGMAFTAHRLRRLSDAFVEATGQWLSAQGLIAPPRSASTLRLLLEEKHLSITEIASRLRLSHPFIVRLITELEHLGLVEIVRDKNDRRRSIIRLTGKGLLEARAFCRTAEPLAAAYASLSADAGIDLLSTLNALEEAHRIRSLSDRLGKRRVARFPKDGK